MASGSEAGADRKSDKLLHLAACWPKLLPHRPRTECHICCENKLKKAYTHHKRLPSECREHLQTTCQSCIRSSLSAQLDSSPLLAVGCPQCAASWSNECLRVLLGHKDRKRFQQLDLLAQGRPFVPAPGDMPEAPTLDVLLEAGARLCPWCRFPFCKEGGCDYISCKCQSFRCPVSDQANDCLGSKCNKGFALSYALVLEDGHGRRAKDVSDDIRLGFREVAYN